MIKNLKRVGGALARRGRSAPAAAVEAPPPAGWVLAFAAGTLAGLVVVAAAGLLFKRAKEEREESSREAPPQRKLRGGGSSEEPPAHRTSAFGMQGKRAAMLESFCIFCALSYCWWWLSCATTDVFRNTLLCKKNDSGCTGARERRRARVG